MPNFYKYQDSPTIYGDNNQAFSTPDEFFKAGGLSNFSNVTTIQGSAPSLLTSPTPTPTPNSIVTSTTGTQNSIKNLGNGITGAENNTNWNTFIEKMQANYDKQASDKATADKAVADNQTKHQEQIRQDYLDEIARYNTEYGTDKATAEQRQAAELAPIDRKLQLLHDSQLGEQEQLLQQQRDKLLSANKLELDHLINQREGFIAQARAAYNQADYALSDSLLKNAQATEETIYQRNKDLVGMALQFSQENRAQQATQLAQQKEAVAQQQDTLKFTNDNGITQPYFISGSVIYNSKTLQPEYQNEGGTFKRLSDGKIYGTEKEFFADSGISSFGQIQAPQGTRRTQVVSLDGREVLVDMDTGEPIKDLGAVTYKPSDGDAGTQSEKKGRFISDTRETFKQGKGGDLKINPDGYRNKMYEYERKGYGTIDDFKALFLPSEWLDSHNAVGDLGIQA